MTEALGYGTQCRGIAQFYLASTQIIPFLKFASPAEAGTQLLTPSGRKAELALLADYIDNNPSKY